MKNDKPFDHSNLDRLVTQFPPGMRPLVFLLDKATRGEYGKRLCSDVVRSVGAVTGTRIIYKAQENAIPRKDLERRLNEVIHQYPNDPNGRRLRDKATLLQKKLFPPIRKAAKAKEPALADEEAPCVDIPPRKQDALEGTSPASSSIINSPLPLVRATDLEKIPTPSRKRKATTAHPIRPIPPAPGGEYTERDALSEYEDALGHRFGNDAVIARSALAKYLIPMRSRFRNPHELRTNLLAMVDYYSLLFASMGGSKQTGSHGRAIEAHKDAAIADSMMDMLLRDSKVKLGPGCHNQYRTVALRLVRMNQKNPIAFPNEERIPAQEFFDRIHSSLKSLEETGVIRRGLHGTISFESEHPLTSQWPGHPQYNIRHRRVPLVIPQSYQ